MRVALVHDFLLKLGGAERVLSVLADIYPSAPIFTLLYDENKVGEVFPASRVRCSFLQKIPRLLPDQHRFFTVMMPRAIEEFDLSEFDLVISSSGAFSHGILVGSETKHICYCHSPMRYAWDWSNEYRDENRIQGWKNILYAPLLKYLRQWDFSAGDRPDMYLANSANIARRIRKYYGLASQILYPPVEFSKFRARKSHENYFLIVSTLTPYKRIDLAVQLFNKIGKRLVIIGDGPQRNYLENIAAENIDFLGFKSDSVVKEYLENCRALIFPGEEDFGITPVEAMACGKPVLAYGKGGVLESVIEGESGEFFDEPSVASMDAALARLIYNEKFYRAYKIRGSVKKFSKENFEKRFKEILSSC